MEHALMSGRRRALGVCAVVVLSGSLSALLAGCGVRGVQVQQSPLLRFFERASGLIAYVGRDGNVRLVDQRAGHAVMLTEDAGQTPEGLVAYGLPTWAPDGRQVVFPGYRQPTDSQTLTTWIQLADRAGRDRRTLYSSTELRPIYLSWSPDSTQVTVLSSLATAQDLELGVTSAQRQEMYRRLDTGQPYYWVWLPDNRTLAVHVGAERLSLLPADGLGRTQTLPPAAPQFRSPDVSRDGSTLAYARPGNGGVSLVLRRLSTGEESAMVSDPRPVYFAFSGDSRRVAVLQADGIDPIPYGKLSVLAARGSDAQTQTLAEELALAFFWSPTGHRIAYLTLSMDPSTTDPVFLRTTQSIYVVLSAFEPDTGKGWTIAQYPPTAGLLQTLPFFDQYHRSTTVWSPDGRSILFTAYTEDGSAAVFVSSSDGNVKPRRVAHGDSATWSPS